MNPRILTVASLLLPTWITGSKLVYASSSHPLLFSNIIFINPRANIALIP